MDNKQAKKLINDQLELYLEGKGIDTSKDFNCLNPFHTDNKACMTIDRSMGQPFHAQCKACNAFYNTLDLIEIEYRLTDSKEAFNKACELFHIVPDDSQTNTSHNSRSLNDSFKVSNWLSRLGSKTSGLEKLLQSDSDDVIDQESSALEKYINKTHNQIDQTEYFKNKGLSHSTIEKFKLGYDPDYKTKEGAEYVSWQAVIIPIGEHGYIAVNIDNYAEKHNRIRRKGPNIIFNQAALQSDRPVFIVHEEIEALSVIEAGAEAIAITSPGNMRLLLEILKNAVPAGGLVICHDNDENPFVHEIGSLFRTHDIPFMEANLSGDFKELSEALSMARDQFVQIVQATEDLMSKQLKEKRRTEHKDYLNNKNTQHLQGFMGIKDNVNTVCIPTGFKKLDQLLDGGLYEGLYVVTGGSSCGKTSWALQLADQIAQSSNDVLIFSLETARTELIAKSISRLTFLENSDKSLALSARGITTTQKYSQYSKAQIDSIKTSIENYGKFAERLYIIEGNDYTGVNEIRDILIRHIRIIENRPVIIVDFLQLLEANYPGEHTFKEKVNRVMTQLKRISRDFKTPVLAVSAKDMEAVRINDSISGSIDVLLGLQTKEADSKDSYMLQPINPNLRELKLKLLKNRNGTSGSEVLCNYYPAFNCFLEK